MNWGAIALTLKLASCVSLILLVVGLPIAWWLSQTRWRGKFLVEAVVLSTFGGVVGIILGPIGDANIEVDMIIQNIGADGCTDVTFTVNRTDFAKAKKILEKNLRKELALVLTYIKEKEMAHGS